MSILVLHKTPHRYIVIILYYHLLPFIRTLNSSILFQPIIWLDPTQKPKKQKSNSLINSIVCIISSDMNDSHMHDPPPTKNGTGELMMHLHKKMMMHMTFYWGKEAEVLFSGWPGKRAGMYALALIFVFALGIIAEWLTHSRLIKEGTTNVVARITKTILHAIRVSLGYLLMLSLMSFNAGIFLAAVAGQALGFLLFGSMVFDKTEFPPYEKPSESCWILW